MRRLLRDEDWTPRRCWEMASLWTASLGNGKGAQQMAVVVKCNALDIAGN